MYLLLFPTIVNVYCCLVILLDNLEKLKTKHILVSSVLNQIIFITILIRTSSYFNFLGFKGLQVVIEISFTFVLYEFYSLPGPCGKIFILKFLRLCFYALLNKSVLFPKKQVLHWQAVFLHQRLVYLPG